MEWYAQLLRIMVTMILQLNIQIEQNLSEEQFLISILLMQKKESVPKQNPIEVKGSFAELYTDLLVDWDYEKNSIDPTQIIAGYSEKVF